MWALKMMFGDSPGRITPVSGSPFQIGRSASADLHLSHDAVSRTHCRLTVTDDALAIEDCNSCNGTHVNCRPIHVATPLQSSDLIRIGPFLFLVVDSGIESTASSLALCVRKLGDERRTSFENFVARDYSTTDRSAKM